MPRAKACTKGKETLGAVIQRRCAVGRWLTNSIRTDVATMEMMNEVIGN